MADISKIIVDGTEYDIKDTTARAKLSIPSGGKTGQVLVKKSDTDGDVDWYSQDKFPADPNWFIPTGMSSANVVAAYRFVGAANEATAMKDLNGNDYYSLQKVNTFSGYSVSWNQPRGMLFPAGSYLKIGYEGQTAGGFYNVEFAEASEPSWEGNPEWQYNFNSPVTVTSAVFGYRYAESPASLKASVGICLDEHLFYTRTWQGGSTTYVEYPAMAKADSTAFYKAALEYDRGVLSGSWKSSSSFTICLNGMILSLTTQPNPLDRSRHGYFVIGQNPNVNPENAIPAYVTAVAFYNQQLTASQHMEMYNRIKALGGGID